MEMKRDRKEILILHGINKKNKELLNKVIRLLDKENLDECKNNCIFIALHNKSLISQVIIDELLKINISSEKHGILKKYALINNFRYNIEKNILFLNITNIDYLKKLKIEKNINSFYNLIKYLSMKPIYQSFFDFLISKRDKENVLSSEELYQLLEKELTYNSSNFNKILKNLEKDFKEIYFPNFSLSIEKIYKIIYREFLEEKNICGCRKKDIFFRIEVKRLLNKEY